MLLLCGYKLDMDGDYWLDEDGHHTFACFMYRHVHVYAISSHPRSAPFGRNLNSRDFSYRETLKRLKKDRHII